MADLYIHNIGLLATPRFAERDTQQRPVHQIPRAAILIQNGRVTLAGAEAEIAPRVPQGIPRYDAAGRLALPGFVDCHTHPVFVGNRAHEFHLRNAGKTYLEIAAAGGGIQASAAKVREASSEQVVAESLPRFARSLRGGVTTIEGKSGYGLDWDGEVKLLEALREIGTRIPQRLATTFLIHAVPKEWATRRAEFVTDVCERILPGVAAQKLATAVDVFCETGAFTVEESRLFLRRAAELSLMPMIHANQFGHSGGALLAAELKAVSAHHLEYLNDAEIDAMVAAGVVGVALPASVFFLGNLPYPPTRMMIERGLRVAIATDMNPGSSMTESLPFCLTAAAIYCHLTPEELLWGVTLDAARAMRLEREVGALETGYHGDVSLWDVPDLESLAYHFGDVRAAGVVIGGEMVWQDPDANARY